MAATISSPEFDERLTQLWGTRTTIEGIAYELHTTTTTVDNARKRLGLPARATNGRTVPQETIDAVCSDCRAGMTRLVLAEKYGLTKGQVSGLLHRAGLTNQHPEIAAGQARHRAEVAEAKARAAAGPAPSPRPVVRRLPTPPPPVRPRSFKDLGNRCCWITNDGKPWRYCDAPVDGDRPYCPSHVALAYERRPHAKHEAA